MEADQKVVNFLFAINSILLKLRPGRLIDMHITEYKTKTSLFPKKYYYIGITSNPVKTMRVTSKGQVTIPQYVRESMGILPAETEIEFIQDKDSRWYITKAKKTKKRASRFRTAYQKGKLTMSTDDIMALTRGN